MFSVAALLMRAQPLTDADDAGSSDDSVLDPQFCFNFPDKPVVVSLVKKPGKEESSPQDSSEPFQQGQPISSAKEPIESGDSVLADGTDSHLTTSDVTDQSNGEGLALDKALTNIPFLAPSTPVHHTIHFMNTECNCSFRSGQVFPTKQDTQQGQVVQILRHAEQAVHHTHCKPNRELNVVDITEQKAMCPSVTTEPMETHNIECYVSGLVGYADSLGERQLDPITSNIRDNIQSSFTDQNPNSFQPKSTLEKHVQEYEDMVVAHLLQWHDEQQISSKPTAQQALSEGILSATVDIQNAVDEATRMCEQIRSDASSTDSGQSIEVKVKVLETTPPPSFTHDDDESSEDSMVEHSEDILKMLETEDFEYADDICLQKTLMSIPEEATGSSLESLHHQSTHTMESELEESDEDFQRNERMFQLGSPEPDPKQQQQQSHDEDDFFSFVESSQQKEYEQDICTPKTSPQLTELFRRLIAECSDPEDSETEHSSWNSEVHEEPKDEPPQKPKIGFADIFPGVDHPSEVPAVLPNNLPQQIFAPPIAPPRSRKCRSVSCIPTQLEAENLDFKAMKDVLCSGATYSPFLDIQPPVVRPPRRKNKKSGSSLSMSDVSLIPMESRKIFGSIDNFEKCTFGSLERLPTRDSSSDGNESPETARIVFSSPVTSAIVGYDSNNLRNLTHRASISLMESPVLDEDLDRVFEPKKTPYTKKKSYTFTSADQFYKEAKQNVTANRDREHKSVRQILKRTFSLKKLHVNSDNPPCMPNLLKRIRQKRKDRKASRKSQLSMIPEDGEMRRSVTSESFASIFMTTASDDDLVSHNRTEFDSYVSNSFLKFPDMSESNLQRSTSNLEMLRMTPKISPLKPHRLKRSTSFIQPTDNPKSFIKRLVTEDSTVSLNPEAIRRAHELLNKSIGSPHHPRPVSKETIAENESRTRTQRASSVGEIVFPKNPISMAKQIFLQRNQQRLNSLTNMPSGSRERFYSLTNMDDHHYNEKVFKAPLSLLKRKQDKDVQLEREPITIEVVHDRTEIDGKVVHTFKLKDDSIAPSSTPQEIKRPNKDSYVVHKFVYHDDDECSNGTYEIPLDNGSELDTVVIEEDIPVTENEVEELLNPSPHCSHAGAENDMNVEYAKCYSKNHKDIDSKRNEEMMQSFLVLNQITTKIQNIHQAMQKHSQELIQSTIQRDGKVDSSEVGDMDTKSDQQVVPCNTAATDEEVRQHTDEMERVYAEALSVNEQKFDLSDAVSQMEIIYQEYLTENTQEHFQNVESSSDTEITVREHDLHSEDQQSIKIPDQENSSTDMPEVCPELPKSDIEEPTPANETLDTELILEEDCSAQIPSQTETQEVSNKPVDDKHTCLAPTEHNNYSAANSVQFAEAVEDIEQAYPVALKQTHPCHYLFEDAVCEMEQIYAASAETINANDMTETVELVSSDSQGGKKIKRSGSCVYVFPYDVEQVVAQSTHTVEEKDKCVVEDNTSDEKECIFREFVDSCSRKTSSIMTDIVSEDLITGIPPTEPTELVGRSFCSDSALKLDEGNCEVEGNCACQENPSNTHVTPTSSVTPFKNKGRSHSLPVIPAQLVHLPEDLAEKVSGLSSIQHYVLGQPAFKQSIVERIRKYSQSSIVDELANQCADSSAIDEDDFDLVLESKHNDVVVPPDVSNHKTYHFPYRSELHMTVQYNGCVGTAPLSNPPSLKYEEVDSDLCLDTTIAQLSDDNPSALSPNPPGGRKAMKVRSPYSQRKFIVTWPTNTDEDINATYPDHYLSSDSETTPTDSPHNPFVFESDTPTNGVSKIRLRTWSQRGDEDITDPNKQTITIKPQSDSSNVSTVNEPEEHADTPSPGPPLEIKDQIQTTLQISSDTLQRKDDRAQKDRCIEVYPETLRQRQRSMAPSPSKVDIKNWEGNTDDESKGKKFLPSVKALRNQFENGGREGSPSPPSTFSLGRSSSSSSSSTSSLVMPSIDTSSGFNSMTSSQVTAEPPTAKEPEVVEPIFRQFNKADDYSQGQPPSTAEWNPESLIKKLYALPEAPKANSRAKSYINIEGYLEKLPSGRKKSTYWNAWKKRYFSAEDGILYCYQSHQKDKLGLKLPLMGGRIEIMDPNIVSVEDGKGHYVVVRCSSRQEADKWKSALDTQTIEDGGGHYVQPVPRPTNPTFLRDTIIIDIGSSSVRAGVLASQATLPQVFFPSVVATNRQTQRQIWGTEALSSEVRSTSNISFPVRPSHRISKYSVDLNTVSSLLQKAFQDLKVDPKNYNIQLSVPRVLNPNTQAELLKILFETYGVKGVNLTHQSILALFAYNATSGIVVDIGERIDVVPVTDGYIVDGGVSRVPYGGSRIQEHLKNFLAQRNMPLVNEVDSYVLRQILESVCYCAQHYNTEKARCTNDPESFEKDVPLGVFFPQKPQYEAFHDLSLDFGRFQATEGLFNPDAWGLDHPGLHKLVHKAIQECSMDIRKEMSRSIFLAGGVSQLPGLADRLTAELDNLTPAAIRPKVHSSPYRYHAAYLGACVLAESPTFLQSKISKEEWQKQGNSVLRKWSL